MVEKPCSAHGVFRLMILAVNWTLAGHQIRIFHIRVPTTDSRLVALRVVSIIAS